MTSRPDKGLHHADDTDGGDTILVEIVAAVVPQDSPEFLEHERADYRRNPARKPLSWPQVDEAGK